MRPMILNSYNFNRSINRWRTKIDDLSYRPTFINQINSGEIKLFTEIIGNPILELYVLSDISQMAHNTLLI